MTTTLLQHDIKWNDATANMQTVAEMLQSLNTDIVVLPEMWNTGFITDPMNTEVAPYDESLAFMQQWAKKLDAAIVGSMPTQETRNEKQETNYYNRLYFVRPDGTYATYDKRHLFSYAGEDKHYTPGTKPLIVEWRGLRIMLQICYDLRFPVFSRNRIIQDSSPASQSHIDSPSHFRGEDQGEEAPLYDLCIYIASWPESRRCVWDTLLQARAIENQCYVIGVNRIGDDQVCHYNGGTQLVDAYGKVIAMAADNKPSIITETLDQERLNRFRKKFPVLMDGDI